MKIKLNGEEKIVENGTNILSLIEEYKLRPEAIVVEYNLNVLDKGSYNKTYLNEDDSVEIVKFIGGG